MVVMMKGGMSDAEVRTGGRNDRSKQRKQCKRERGRGGLEMGKAATRAEVNGQPRAEDPG